VPSFDAGEAPRRSASLLGDTSGEGHLKAGVVVCTGRVSSGSGFGGGDFRNAVFSRVGRLEGRASIAPCGSRNGFHLCICWRLYRFYLFPKARVLKVKQLFWVGAAFVAGVFVVDGLLIAGGLIWLLLGSTVFAFIVVQSVGRWVAKRDA
jgi:hypothetical protein